MRHDYAIMILIPANFIRSKAAENDHRREA